jgi:hypothetical protein
MQSFEARGEPADRAEVEAAVFVTGLGDDRRSVKPLLWLVTFRRKIEALGCCGRIAQGMENCKVGQI